MLFRSERIDGGGIGLSHTDVDEVTTESVQEFLVAQAGRGPRLAPSIDVDKEGFEMIGAEGGQRALSRLEVSHEALEHGFVLDDRPRRESPPIGTGCLIALPFLVGLGRCRQPESRIVHLILYTEYRELQA